MAEGWINIERRILDHWLWTADKPYSYGQAFIDMLFMANFKENTVVVGGKLIKLEPGEFAASDRYLMQRWGWGNSRLRHFFKLLENDTIVERKLNQNQTVIKLCKYSLYQLSQITNKSQPNHSQITAKSKQINKESNKEKNNARARARERNFDFEQRHYSDEEFSAFERRKLGIGREDDNVDHGSGSDVHDTV